MKFHLEKTLKCYSCESRISWEDCETRKSDITCRHYCARTEYEETAKSTGQKHVYKKGCADTFNDKDQQLCRHRHKDGKPLSCQVFFCNTALCNKGINFKNFQKSCTPYCIM